MISICGVHPELFSVFVFAQRANAGFQSWIGGPTGGQGFTFLGRGETLCEYRVDGIFRGNIR